MIFINWCYQITQWSIMEWQLRTISAAIKNKRRSPKGNLPIIVIDERSKLISNCWHQRRRNKWGKWSEATMATMINFREVAPTVLQPSECLLGYYMPSKPVPAKSEVLTLIGINHVCLEGWAWTGYTHPLHPPQLIIEYSIYQRGAARMWKQQICPTLQNLHLVR